MHRIITIIIAVTFYASEVAYAMTPALVFPEPTKSTQPIYYQIGDTMLAVPAQYILFAHERMPTETKQLRMGIWMPEYRPFGIAAPYGTQAEQKAWNVVNTQYSFVLTTWQAPPEPVSAKLAEAESNIPQPEPPPPPPPLHQVANGTDTPKEGEYHVRMDNLDIRYRGYPLAEEKVRSIIRPFILKEKPEDWDERLALSQALNVRKQFVSQDCMLPKPARPGLDCSPPEPPLVALDIIKKGLADVLPRMRLAAIEQLGRYKHTANPEISRLLEQAYYNDSGEKIRADALVYLLAFAAADADKERWVAHALKNDASAKVKDTAMNFGGISAENAVTLIIPLLDDEDMRVRDVAVRKLCGMIIQEVRQNKLVHPTELSAPANQMLDALIATFDRQSKHAQTDILMLVNNTNMTPGVGSTAVATPAYVNLVVKNVPEEGQAISSAGALGELAAKAAPKLEGILQEKKYTIYPTVIEALGNMPVSGKKAIPRLIELTQFYCLVMDQWRFYPKAEHSPTNENEQDVFSLPSLPGYSPARPAQPIPKGIIAEKCWYGVSPSNIRNQAILALGKLGVDSPEVENAILEALRLLESKFTIDTQQSSMARVAAEKLGIGMDKVVPVLVKGLSHSQKKARSNAEWNLESLGTKAVPALEASLAVESDKTTRDSIKRIIASINERKQME